MEITQDNFEAQFPLIKESIKNAEFISIDTEFSGYSASLDDKPHDYDTVEERYQKVRFACQRFMAFQFGICTFHWDNKAKKYKCRPFYFYVFPKSKINNDTCMLFQASAVNFLTQNSFDFKKLFEVAITFTSLGRKDKLMKECENKVYKGYQYVRTFNSLSTAHQKQLQVYMKEIDEFVYDTNSELTHTYQIQSYALRKALAKEVTNQYKGTGVFTDFTRGSSETVIKKAKTFKQRNFMRGVAAQNDENDSQCSSLGFQLEEEEIKEEVAKKNAGPDKAQIEQQKKDDQKQIDTLFDQELGFSKVIQELMEAKKPIVGHNLIYDIAFIYRQFVSPNYDLPNTFEEFASSWKKHFSCTIYDTKVLSQYCGTNLFGKTDLQYIYDRCKSEKKLNNNVFFEFDEHKDSAFGIYKNKTSQISHDAGYDAFMTGQVFMSISKYIEIGKIVIPAKADSVTKQSTSVALTQSSTTKSKSSQLPKGQELMSQQPAKRKGKQQKNVDEEDKQMSDASSDSSLRRKIKHYSMVQNRPVFYEDLQDFKNKILLSIDIPRFFYLDATALKTKEEIEYDKRMKSSVIFVKLSENINAKEIAGIFSTYGDINVVKNTNLSCFVEFSFIDSNFVKSQTIKELIKVVESDFKKQKKQQVKSMVTFEEAPRFNCSEASFTFAQYQ